MNSSESESDSDTDLETDTDAAKEAASAPDLNKDKPHTKNRLLNELVGSFALSGDGLFSNLSSPQ